MSLEFASKKLKDDKDIVLTAIKQSGIEEMSWQLNTHPID